MGNFSTEVVRIDDAGLLDDSTFGRNEQSDREVHCADRIGELREVVAVELVANATTSNAATPSEPASSRGRAIFTPISVVTEAMLPLEAQRNDFLQNLAQTFDRQARFAQKHGGATRRRHPAQRPSGGAMAGWDQAEMSGAPTGPISS